MRQGLDIVDVEERTKIRAKYLRALENEEWSALPGHTFVKTFLRTYAEQVGVDPHLLVEEYRMSHESEEREFVPSVGPPAASRREARRGAGRRSRPASARPPPPRGGVITVLALLAVVAFIFVLGLVGDDDPAEERSAGEQAQTDREPAERPSPRRRRPATPAGVTMRITPSLPTYACVDTGEGTDAVFEGTLDAQRTFRNRRMLRVNLGKRSVELVVNGDAVEIVESGEPVGFVVTRGGAEEITEGNRPCN